MWARLIVETPPLKNSGLKGTETILRRAKHGDSGAPLEGDNTRCHHHGDNQSACTRHHDRAHCNSGNRPVREMVVILFRRLGSESNGEEKLRSAKSLADEIS